jgi:NAD(P)-dependent dehydrogenase (short-subunit alcohol dehydrogenase family)
MSALESSLLAGKVAIVSGVGSGLGRSIALALAKNGATVALGARTESMLDEVAQEIALLGGNAWWRRLDIADPAGPADFVEACQQDLGNVQILVNNGHHKGDFQPLPESNVDEWPEIFAVNTYGPMRLIQAVLPGMAREGGGSIVNVNSGAAVNSNPGLGAYSASKSALASLTRTLAGEIGADNIRVNGLYVSSMVGDNVISWGTSVAAAEGISFDEWFQRKQREEFALRRMPTTDDIADAVLFLVSDLARSMTGQNIAANNGQWVVGPQ